MRAGRFSKQDLIRRVALARVAPGCGTRWHLVPRLALLVIVIAAASFVGAERLPVKIYTTADGLGHNNVNRIARDSRGFLWFCTFEGLSRFDSYGFTTYGVAEPAASAQKNSAGGLAPPVKTNIPDDLVVNGNLIFTPPSPVFTRDITMQNNNGGLRFFGAPTLTTNPAVAAIQFRGNASPFPGQLYLDSGAHDSAALIIRTAGNGGTITERMRVTATGNVGIGTNAPANKLDVNGGIRAFFNSSTGVVAETSGGTNAWARFHMNTPSQRWFIGTSNNFNGNQFYLVDDTNGQTPRLTIQPAGGTIAFPLGNVGIGAATPAHRLSIGDGPFWTSNGWKGALEMTNASAIGWQGNAAGIRFGIGQTNGGLYFFRTASNPGTTGNGAAYDLVITDNGHITQPLVNGGLVKVMIYVTEYGTVLRCYNGQMPDGGASDPPNGDRGCGIRLRPFNPECCFGERLGFEVIFNFQVSNRFWSVTNAGSSSANEYERGGRSQKSGS